MEKSYRSPKRNGRRPCFRNGSCLGCCREKYRTGEIGKEDYDKWRYRYPQYDDTRIWAEVPSKELTDSLVEELKDETEDRS